MNRREYNCVIPVTLTVSDAEIIERATILGLATGRDRGWRPNDLNAAVAEIVILSDVPADCGVEVDI